MSLPGIALLLVRALPTEPAVALARLLVLLYLLFRPDYRREAGRNFRLVAGSPGHWFWVRNGWAVGRNVALMATRGSRRTTTIIDRARIYADNLTRQTLEQELHTLMASFHFGLWELLPQAFARVRSRVNVVTGRQRDPVVAQQMRRLRAGGGVRELDGLRELLACVAQPGVTGFMLDNTQQGRQERVRVGDLSIRVPDIGFRMAERRQTKMMPIAGRLERGRLMVRVGRPGTRQQVVAALLEEVRQRPEEWVAWGKEGAVEGGDGGGAGRM